MFRTAARLGVLAAGVAFAAHAAGTTDLDGLVAAERAFAARSIEHGMKDAFLANLAPDGVVFRPAPRNGRQLWRSRPNPAATLAWAPDYAEISGDGDLGVTSGPWEFRPPGGRNATAYGHFISVWRKSKDGVWQVAADIGVDHDRHAASLDAVDVTAGPAHARPEPLPHDFNLAYDGGFSFAGGPGYVPLKDRLRAKSINEMMTAERSMVYLTRNEGIERAYREHADHDLRVYRAGSFPMIGASADGALAKRGRRVEIAPRGDGMASSRDLGYSYGLLIARASANARPDTVSYLHVWRRAGDGPWKLALDVENEFARK